MAIKILRSGLPVLGLAKLGMPTLRSSPQKGAPIKFDHIEITGRERDADGVLCPDVALMRRIIDAGAKTCAGCERAKRLGFANGLPTEIPILLPYSDLELNLPHRLAYYRGRTVFCSGDGELAHRLEILETRKERGDDGKEREVPVYGAPKQHLPCGAACPDFEARRCKPSGRLRFLLAGMEAVGGCYEYRSTSWNSIANLVESLQLIQAVTGGVLSWIRLVFAIAPQTVQPKGGGRAMTAQIARVYYPGGPQTLLEEARAQLQLRAPVLREVRLLEAQIKRSGAAWEMTPEEVEEFREEFDFEALEAEAAAPTPLPAPPAAEAAEPATPSLPPDDHPDPFAPEPRITPDPLINQEDRSAIMAAGQARIRELGAPAASLGLLLKNALRPFGLKSGNELKRSQVAEFLEAIKKAGTA